MSGGQGGRGRWILQASSRRWIWDRRLDERVVELIESLSRQPMVSINAACSGLAETAAEYRYIDHISVTPEKLLELHWAATFERIKGQPVMQ